MSKYGTGDMELREMRSQIAEMLDITPGTITRNYTTKDALEPIYHYLKENPRNETTANRNIKTVPGEGVYGLKTRLNKSIHEKTGIELPMQLSVNFYRAFMEYAGIEIE